MRKGNRINITFSRNNNTDDSNSSMMDYLRFFDPIAEKYFFDVLKYPPSTSAKQIASEFEYSRQFGKLTKRRYSYIQENLRLVYCDSDMVDDDIITYHLAEEKIIHRFLGIPQLDSMFDEDYFNFEWDMHVGQNYNEHKNNFYRDHFIHQVRDMYMILELLEMDKLELKSSVESILKDRSISKISEYCSKKFSSFMADIASPQMATIKGVAKELRKIDDSGMITDADKRYVEDYIGEYFYNYVIKASLIMAALFHDMGYPVCHFLEVRERLSNYNPTLYMFTQNAVGSLDQIASILAPSLLFTRVSLANIRKSLEKDKDGKYDHGAYSAISFLLQFYNNGMIFSLSEEKQCAIELAALAIYDHTAAYSIVKEKKNRKELSYYSLFFRQNPISFLLRMCDDLQEWDRRYFEISECSDILFCSKCHTPLQKKTVTVFPAASSNFGVKRRHSTYTCFCSEDGLAERPDVFSKRKLYLVSVADSVSAQYDENDRSLVFTFNYDLYKMLQLCNINNTYAKYRIKELKKLQKLLNDQVYSDNLKAIKLDYFMTANPILIKIRILEECISNQTESEQGIISSIDSYIENTDSLLNKLIHDDYKHIDQLEAFYKDALSFYLTLLKACLTGNDNDYDYDSLYYQKHLDAFKPQSPNDNNDALYYNALTFLVDDCKNQYKNNGKPNKSNKNLFYQYIGAYTNSENNFNKYSFVKKNSGTMRNGYYYIGYFGDMYLFKLMCEK